MGNPIKVKYKFGQIEFEAEGDSFDVEKQRDYFMNAIIPVATSIISRVSEKKEENILIEDNSGNFIENKETGVSIKKRENLIIFIQNYGELSDREFALFSAYFHEQNNYGQEYKFTSEDVKNYFSEGRRKVPSNTSDILQKLAKSGLIIEVDNPEKKNHRQYMLSSKGIGFIQNYIPKSSTGKKISKKNNVVKKSSVYATLNSDELNLTQYPELNKLNTAKDQIILAMYIVTNENKGEWFKISDLEYILLNVFNIRVTKDQLNNVFRNKSWFASEKAEDESKSLKYRMLSLSKNYANEIIEKNKE